jgi:tripartite-type tricarboxylate transporter receptor subunit TctC
MKKLAALFAAAVTALVLAQPATAADWPTHAVRIIVPYGAGGAADTLARLIAQPLSKTFNQQFYIENRPGAGGLTGSVAIARADADGYTLGLVGMSTHVLAPAMNPNVPLDPLKEFTEIAYLGGAPNIFVVHPTYPAKTFKDFMAAAKDGKDINYVSPGIGSVGNLVAEYLASKEHLKLVHVPYKGGAAALTDLIAGHVKVGMMSYSTAGAQIRAGKLVPLAVSSSKRLKDLPDVPTLKELGYPELVATTWWAIAAPANLPKEITDKVNAAVNTALNDPTVQHNLAQDAVEVEPKTPQQMTAFMKSEINKWVPVIKTSIKK